MLKNVVIVTPLQYYNVRQTQKILKTIFLFRSFTDYKNPQVFGIKTTHKNVTVQSKDTANTKRGGWCLQVIWFDKREVIKVMSGSQTQKTEQPHPV